MRKTSRLCCYAVFCLCAASGAYAADWVYDSSAKTISDGVWTFRATVSGTSLTVGTAVDDTDPSQCPTEVSALDFSKPVVDGADSTKQYTIVSLNTAFWPNNGTKRASADCVGKLTLPGEGLTTLGGEAFRSCLNLFGDLVIPASVTTVGRYGFQNSKITSVTFEATEGGTISSEVFTGCRTMTDVTFKAGGKWTIQNNSRPFNGCWTVGNIDLSGLVSSGGDANHAAFGSCSALTNATLNSDLVLTKQSAGNYGYGLFNANTRLATIRFTGAAPAELDNWISGDGGYLGLFSSSQSVTTIVPAEYRNVKNASGKSWTDYSASGALNTSDTTWAADYVKSDVTDLSKRKLILDRTPDDDPPTVEDPTITGVWAYQATVTANGSGIRGGEVFVSLTNSAGEVTGPVAFDDFGGSQTFTNLACGATYAVLVVATNNYGTVTNASASFTTLAKQADVSVAKGGDADFNRSQSGSFVVSRADEDATDYPLTVKYAIGGTAVAGTDYTALPATVTIPVDEKSVTIPVVPLYCETQVAGDTAVTLTLADDPGYAVGTRTETVNIKKVEAVHYSIAAGTNPTGSTRGTFIVSRGENDPIDQKVTLTYTVSGAGAGVIFPLSGTVVIPPYATSVTIEIFGDNDSGSDAPLTVTLDAGAYTLVTPSATITVTAGAQSECWLVDTSAKTMSWGGWTFGGVDVQKKTVSMGNASLKASPAEVSPLDFSLPVVDADGNRYVITMVSTRGATSAQKSVVGELTLPGEGMTSIDYNAFNGCANMCGTLVFPTSCATIGGESFENCEKIRILGSSMTGVSLLAGKDAFVNVSFEGEVLALSIAEIADGGFTRSKIGAIRFGSGLKKLTRNSGRNGAFEGCSSLTNVVFDPDSRVSFEHGLTFKACASLKSIDLSAVTNVDCTAYGAKDDYGTFYNCTALTNAIFGADLHYLASNVFDQAFNKTAPTRSITFEGLPPEHFGMPYLSRVPGNGSKGYPTITTYVHRKYLNKTNAAGKCWLDFAADGKINRKNSTWSSAFLPAEITDLARRPLCVIEPSGMAITIR